MVEAETNYKQVGATYYYDTLSQPLGAGAFGTVYRGYSLKNDKEVTAIKVISKAILDQYKDYLDLFLREIEILRKIKGKHVLEFKEVLRTSNNIYIITAFCNGGNLEGKLKESGGKISEAESLRILRQIAEAFIEVESLELKNSKGEKLTVMHRDIKPANILFHNGEVCLADFGFAKLVDENTKDKKQFHTILGTPWYMPPQILTGDAYTAKCDVWSMGIVFYQMLHGQVPYKSSSYFGMDELARTKPLELSPSLKPETQDLIKKMLKYDEETRLSWKEILAHPALIPKKSKIRIIE